MKKTMNRFLVYIIVSRVNVSALTYTEEVNHQKFSPLNTETFQTFFFRNVSQNQARFISQARISLQVAVHPVLVQGPFMGASRCVPRNGVLLAPTQSTRTERFQELTALAKVSDRFWLSKKVFQPDCTAILECKQSVFNRLREQYVTTREWEGGRK